MKASHLNPHRDLRPLSPEGLREFARSHSLPCSGSPITTRCGFAPVLVILLHGGPFAVQCELCGSITTRLLSLKGHDSLMTWPLDCFQTRYLVLLAKRLASKPLAFERGRYWSEEKDLAAERDLAELRAELSAKPGLLGELYGELSSVSIDLVLDKREGSTPSEPR